jgi:hypothetical protein
VFSSCCLHFRRCSASFRAFSASRSLCSRSSSEGERVGLREGGRVGRREGVRVCRREGGGSAGAREDSLHCAPAQSAGRTARGGTYRPARGGTVGRREGGRVGQRAGGRSCVRGPAAPPGRPRRAAAGLRWRSRGPWHGSGSGRASERERTGAAGCEFTGPRGPISGSDFAVHNILNDLERKLNWRTRTGSGAAERTSGRARIYWTNRSVRIYRSECL